MWEILRSWFYQNGGKNQRFFAGGLSCQFGGRTYLIDNGHSVLIPKLPDNDFEYAVRIDGMGVAGMVSKE